MFMVKMILIFYFKLHVVDYDVCKFIIFLVYIIYPFLVGCCVINVLSLMPLYLQKTYSLLIICHLYFFVRFSPVLTFNNFGIGNFNNSFLYSSWGVCPMRKVISYTKIINKCTRLFIPYDINFYMFHFDLSKNYCGKRVKIQIYLFQIASSYSKPL